jgi:hypothetical protein
MFSLVAMYSSRFRNCVCAERNRVAAHVRYGRAKSRERPYDGKFMRRRRSWKRGSERIGSNVGSALRLLMSFECAW